MTTNRSIHRTILLTALVAMLLGGTTSPAFATDRKTWS